jgi:hypothetical protein
MIEFNCNFKGNKTAILSSKRHKLAQDKIITPDGGMKSEASREHFGLHHYIFWWQISTRNVYGSVIGIVLKNK